MTLPGSDATEPEPRQPLLRVVRGNPTPEELAALIAVVAARAAGGAPEPAPVRPLWGRPVLRTPLFPSPGAWRASTLPR